MISRKQWVPGSSPGGRTGNKPIQSDPDRLYPPQRTFTGRFARYVASAIVGAMIFAVGWMALTYLLWGLAKVFGWL